MAQLGHPPVWLGASGTDAPFYPHRHAPLDGAPVHRRNDADIVDYVVSLGGTPREVAEHDALRAMLLKLAKADFRVIEACFRCRPQRRCPARHGLLGPRRHVAGPPGSVTGCAHHGTRSPSARSTAGTSIYWKTRPPFSTRSARHWPMRCDATPPRRLPARAADVDARGDAGSRAGARRPGGQPSQRIITRRRRALREHAAAHRVELPPDLRAQFGGDLEAVEQFRNPQPVGGEPVDHQRRGLLERHGVRPRPFPHRHRPARARVLVIIDATSTRSTSVLATECDSSSTACM